MSCDHVQLQWRGERRNEGRVREVPERKVRFGRGWVLKTMGNYF